MKKPKVPKEQLIFQFLSSNKSNTVLCC